MANGKSALAAEFRVVPGWAKVLAVIIGACALFGFYWVMGHHKPAPPPPPLRLFVGFLGASVIAILVMLVGYVNADAGRRRMNRWVWTLLVIFVPNALGFILYFLLRKSLPARCPKCAAVVEPDAHYCPRCGTPLTETCPTCHRAVGLTAVYCSNCGHALKPAPASS